MKNVFEEYAVRLEEFFTARFGNTWLPSHNLDHHRRVWRNALTLTGGLAHHGYYFTDDFMLSLMIACYTHDIGMAVNQGEKHGEESRILSAEFLREEEIPTQLHNKILFAVENHDNKTYDTTPSPDSLLAILSVADDMDAFGHTGIYRYTEIYLARRMRPDTIGAAITDNAVNRFQNLERTYGFMEEFCEAQRQNLEILTTFFDENGPVPAGSRWRIIKILETELLMEHKDVSTVSAEMMNDDDPHVASFFSNLKSGLTLQL